MAAKQTVYQIARRSFATQASPSLAVNSYNVKTTVLENKLPVVSIWENSPVTQITVAFRAGPRFEVGNLLGATDVIRSACCGSTRNHTYYSIFHTIDKAGAVVSASCTKEIFSFNLKATRDNIGNVFFPFASIVAEQAFKPWELRDNEKRNILEHSCIPDDALAMDLLHTAAYKTGLGNSFFCPDSKVLKLTHEDLLFYYNEHFTTKRCVVIGAGIDHNILEDFARSLALENTYGPKDTPSTFLGGELRAWSKSAVTTIVVAGEAAGFTKKESAACEVLSRVIGKREPTKYSTNKGLVSKAVEKSHSEFGLNGFYCSYSDSGLVGFVLTITSDPQKAANSAINEFVRCVIKDEDVQTAKNQIKLDLFLNNNSAAGYAETISKQVGQSSLITMDQTIAAIDSVTTNDVREAHKLATKKLAMAVTGRTESVPYLGQILK